MKIKNYKNLCHPIRRQRKARAFCCSLQAKKINLFSGLCKSGLYQNYGWLRLELIRDWRVLSAKLCKSLLQQQTVRFLHVFHAQRTKFRTKESVSMSGYYRPEKKRIIQCTQFADEAALKCFFAPGGYHKTEFPRTYSFWYGP